jgi:hypothetical protein
MYVMKTAVSNKGKKREQRYDGKTRRKGGEQKVEKAEEYDGVRRKEAGKR